MSHDAVSHDVTQELLLGMQHYYSKSFIWFRSEYQSATMTLAGFFPSSNNVCSESKIYVPPLEFGELFFLNNVSPETPWLPNGFLLSDSVAIRALDRLPRTINWTAIVHR